MSRPVLLMTLTAVVLAACSAPPAIPSQPAPAGTLVASAPAVTPQAVLPGEDAAVPGVTLPLTQPLPSLVVLDAGVITTTQAAEGADEAAVVELPVQGAFTIPVWLANGDHKHPLAVILPDAARVCEANEAEEWPCPASLQRNDYADLRYLAQGLALRGYFLLIVNLNGAYTPALDPAQQTERALLIVDRLLTWMADDMRQPWAAKYGGELSQSTDYARMVLVGHGRGAEIALAMADARAGQVDATPGMEPPVGLLLVAPALPAGSALPDLPISAVLPGCSVDAASADLIETTRGDPERSSLLASVALPGATARGFNALLPTESDACDAAALLAPSQQQDWLAAYAPDFADTATGYAPPYPAAGLDVLAPVPDVIHGLPVETSVTDPGRPVPPGQIALFNLGEIVVELSKTLTAAHACRRCARWPATRGSSRTCWMHPRSSAGTNSAIGRSSSGCSPR